MAEQPPTDVETALLLRIANRERQALGQLYSVASPKLFGVLLRMLKDRAEAEEALQDVFVKFWDRASRFDEAKGKGMSWMIAVTRNHALDCLRRRPQARGFQQVAAAANEGRDPIADLPSRDAGPEAQVMAADDARRISECFDTLEPARAQAVRGAYLDGLSYTDLAESLGLPLNTLRTWLRRGLMQLRECMER